MAQFGSDALGVFDKKTISYTYENGWQFTNVFDGATRITDTDARGTLREHVEIRHIAAQTYCVGWTDDEMGPISQVIDLNARVLLAAVPIEGKIEMWTATITDFGDAS